MPKEFFLAREERNIHLRMFNTNLLFSIKINEDCHEMNQLSQKWVGENIFVACKSMFKGKEVFNQTLFIFAWIGINTCKIISTYFATKRDRNLNSLRHFKHELIVNI